MTGPRTVAPGGTGTRPYAHLLPVVAAEVAWGNADLEGFTEGPDGWWAATLRRPLHLDALRAAFDFPSHIELGASPDGTTFVVDGDNRVRVVAAGAVHGPRTARPGLLARVLGRAGRAAGGDR